MDNTSNVQYNMKERRIIDLLPELIVLVTPEGKILQINDKMTKSLTGKNEDLIGKNILDYFPKKVADHRTKMTYKAIESKKTVHFIDKRNDQYFQSSYTPIFDSKGKAIQIFAVVKNITVEKKIEEKYKELVENMNEGLFLLNKNGLFSFANKLMVNRMGLTEQELYKNHFLNFVLPEYKDIALDHFRQLLNGKKKINFEVGFYTKKGEKQYAELTCNPIYKNDEVIGVQCLSINTTKTKKIESALKHSEVKYQTYIDNAPDGVIIGDIKGNFLEVNKAVKKITGYSEKEFNSLSVESITPIEDWNSVLEDFDLLIKKGYSEADHLFIHKNGSIRWWNIRAVRLEDNKIMAFVKDITDKKNSENKLYETKKYLDNVINNTNEIIFTINKNKKITLWNDSAQRVSDKNFMKLKDMEISKINFIDNHKDFLNFIDSTFSNKKREIDQIIIKKQDSTSRILKPSVSVLRDINGAISDIIFICKDVTFDYNMHYQIVAGNSYFLDSQKSNNLNKLILGFINQNKYVLYLTREPVNINTSIRDSSYLTIQLFSSIQSEKYQSIKNINELKNSIFNFIKIKNNAIIIIDRIDYLFNINGFKQLIPTFYEINDEIKRRKSNLIIFLNNNILSKNEYFSIKEEFKSFPIKQIDNIYLDKISFEILDFIYQENKWNKIVNQSRIVRTFNISKITAQKRINEFLDYALINSKTKGKSKQLFITVKGKELIKKSNSENIK